VLPGHQQMGPSEEEEEEEEEELMHNRVALKEYSNVH
jgi:hypothetical protein